MIVIVNLNKYLNRMDSDHIDFVLTLPPFIIPFLFSFPLCSEYRLSNSMSSTLIECYELACQV